MKIKQILYGLSLIGLLAASLSFSACGGGEGAGSPETNQPPPKPIAQMQGAPSGYVLTQGSALGVSDVFTSWSESGMLTGLALPKSPDKSALQIRFPDGQIGLTNLVSAHVHLFASLPVALVTSTITGGIVVNVFSAPLTEGDGVNVDATAATPWRAYTFNNTTSTSNPVALSAANGGIFAGTSVDAGGGFLAYKSTPNSSTDPVYLATPASCGVKAASTSATTIYPLTVSGGALAGSYIAIGTNQGEVLIFAISGAARGGCKNLTSISKAITSYSFGSPIIAVSFTTFNAHDYVYFLTQSGQVWRIVADKDNNPISFTQINSSDAFSGAVPSAVAGSLTTLFSDAKNNVFVGSGAGTFYLLAPTNSGAVNTVWTSTSIMETEITSTSAVKNSGVISTSVATDGSIVAVTGNNLYNVTVQ